MNRIQFHPKAMDEFSNSKNWYNKQEEKLGDLFVKEIGRGIDYIKIFPTLWSKYHRGTRRFILKKFPYSIIYKNLRPNRIVIVAIMHQKQKPDYWTNRLK